eukprot:g3073.t1
MELSRCELTQVAPIVGLHACRVMPLGKHKTQRVVVGDGHGDVLCFAMKKGAAKTQWKLSLAKGSGKDIDSSVLGGGKSSSGDNARSSSAEGSIGTGGGKCPILTMQLAGDKGDRVFVSQKSGITGVNRKGSVFYGFAPPISDPVSSFSVAGSFLHAASQNSYTLFKESREAYHTMCPGRINALIRVPTVDSGEPSPQDSILLGCEDRTIRHLRGSADFAQEAHVSGIVTALASQMKGKKSDTYYGLGNGKIGCLHNMLQSTVSSSSSPQKSPEGKNSVSESEDSASARHGWSMSNPAASAVNCLTTSWDPFQDGTDHMVVAKDDGTLQVFGLNLNDGSATQIPGTGFETPFSNSVSGASSSSSRSSHPSLRFETQTGESIRSIGIGRVSAPQYDELVVSTFTGRVCSFTTESVSSIDPSDKYGRSKLQLRNEGLIVETKKEIDGLRKQINKEMAKARGISKKSSSKKSAFKTENGINFGKLRIGVSGGSDLVHQFHVNMDSKTASYQCRVELATPIDYVVLVGDIMGAQIYGTESSSGDVVICQNQVNDLDLPSDTSDVGGQGVGAGGARDITATGTRRSLLATIRPAVSGTSTDQLAFGGTSTEKAKDAFASDTKIIEWCIRPVEGQHGTIKIIVVSSMHENVESDLSSKKRDSSVSERLHKRQALELRMDIKPLSLHERVHEEVESQIEGQKCPRVMSLLMIKGTFSVERAHKWLLLMLPDVSPQFDGTSHMKFQNAMIKTLLEVSFSEGSLEFRSDNISTLAIIKDTISKEAISTNTKLNITAQIHPEGPENMMNRLRPLIEAQFALSRDVQLIEAIKEAAGDDLTENGGAAVEYLDPRLVHLLENANEMTKKLKENPMRLNLLFGAVSDLFIDFHLFKGRKLVHLMEKLGGLLANYNHDTVLSFIQNPS